LFDKDQIGLTIEKTLQGSVNLAFNDQREILLSSFDFFNTTTENTVDVSIFAIKI